MPCKMRGRHEQLRLTTGEDAHDHIVTLTGRHGDADTNELFLEVEVLQPSSAYGSPYLLQFSLSKNEALLHVVPPTLCPAPAP
jgi:hypothetical protein